MADLQPENRLVKLATEVADQKEPGSRLRSELNAITDPKEFNAAIKAMTQANLPGYTITSSENICSEPIQLNLHKDLTVTRESEFPYFNVSLPKDSKVELSGLEPLKNMRAAHADECQKAIEVEQLRRQREKEYNEHMMLISILAAG